MKKFKIIALCLLVTITSVTTASLKVNAATQASITRDQAQQRALSMINLTWTYSNNKNAVLDSNYIPLVSQPTQYNNVISAQETGIPYDWGGQDGIDSSSAGAPWGSFLDAINKGAYAGNVNTTVGYGYVPETAGIDCSGFVQAVFNIKDYKLSTSTMFNTYFTKINLTDIQHMDILDKPGDHVVVFDKWGTLNGVSGAYTYESTPDATYGGIEGTKQYFMPMSVLNSGYIGGRYVNISDDILAATSTTATTTTSTTTTTSSSNGSYVQITNVNYAANLRNVASTSGAILNIIPKGSILSIVGSSNGWYQVKYNGQTGWVSGIVSTIIPSGKTVTVNNVYQLNIRSNSSMTSNILGVISQSQTAAVLDYSVDGNWYKISLNGIQGWAYSSYLKFTN